MLLALETATESGGVALLEGGKILEEETIAAERSHASMLMGAIDRVLQSAGTDLDRVDRVALSIGPGSFTGLRVGLATALGGGGGAWKGHQAGYRRRGQRYALASPALRAAGPELSRRILKVALATGIRVPKPRRLKVLDFFLAKPLPQDRPSTHASFIDLCCTPGFLASVRLLQS